MREISRTEYENIISEWVHSERDRKIIRRKILDGITFEQLAEESDLSVSQVKRIVYHTKEIIMNHI
jgi:hypothetical protein